MRCITTDIPVHFVGCIAKHKSTIEEVSRYQGTSLAMKYGIVDKHRVGATLYAKGDVPLSQGIETGQPVALVPRCACSLKC